MGLGTTEEKYRDSNIIRYIFNSKKKSDLVLSIKFYSSVDTINCLLKLVWLSRSQKNQIYGSLRYICSWKL